MLPILINLGPIQIRSFGVFLVLAFLFGTFIVWREGQRQGYNEEKLIDLSITTIITGFLGARIYYVFSNLGYYSSKWSEAYSFWEGGLSYHGAIIGGILGFIWFTRVNKWPFFQVADFACLAVILGTIIGKFGSILNGDDFGTPSSLPWAVKFPGIVGTRHPSPIYEAIILLVTYLLLLRKYRSKERSGSIFFSFLTLLGAGRITSEVFRDNPTYILGLREGFWGGGALVLVGGAGLYWFYHKYGKQDIKIDQLWAKYIIIWRRISKACYFVISKACSSLKLRIRKR